MKTQTIFIDRRRKGDMFLFLIFEKKKLATVQQVHNIYYLITLYLFYFIYFICHTNYKKYRKRRRRKKKKKWRGDLTETLTFVC